MRERIEYETPLVQIRGVFLFEGIAEKTSVLVGTIRQQDWDSDDDTAVGDRNLDGDMDLVF
jgi:hypothetical protein